MGFERKVWFDRESEYPNRRQFTPEEGGGATTYLVQRDEGIVYEEGDAFDAETMNDLEERIEAGLAQKMEAGDTVNNAERLGGNPPEHFATADGLELVRGVAEAALPLRGGTLTGNVRTMSGINFMFGSSAVNSNIYSRAPDYLIVDTGCSGTLFRDPGTGGMKPVWASNTSAPSSRRYKRDIEEMELEAAKRLLRARVCSFKYRERPFQTDERLHYGLIAEELEEIDGSYVYHNGGEVEGINYADMVPALLKLLQWQAGQIEQLQRAAGLWEECGDAV